MGYHLLMYEEALGVAAADSDLDAVPDAEISNRNSHFILSEQFNLIAIYYMAASATRARLNVPTLNAIARHQIWPVDRSATVIADPSVPDLRDYPIALPLNEEIAVEGSNDLGAATENSTCFLFIAPPNWTRNLPRGLARVQVRATGAVAGVAQSWSLLGNLTFAENLRGGWYSIIGANCFDAGTLALRFVFPKPEIHQGRKLRPGIICQETIGNKPWPLNRGGLGVLGSFHSFEPPQIEIYANATAASTQEIRLDLVYHGTERGSA